ncbi:hypothetical protein F4818DRAFT_423433 [Hypoxylon cercidicola]|nr:hypothetical protein F4818DRAFT_423433 [Hypoxylon cercidicola]
MDGDLGTNPGSLEFKLAEIFDAAIRWDAILLLDEADVFLQDRDYENLNRNALVSCLPVARFAPCGRGSHSTGARSEIALGVL